MSSAIEIVRESLARPDAVALVREYFDRQDGDRQGFSGAWFEHLGGGGDAEDVWDRFTAEDIVAVSMLSVGVPAHAAKVLIASDSERFSALLREIPRGLSIEDGAGRALLLDDGAAGYALWGELRQLKGVGRTKASKLMARKRPALFPVYDSVLVAVLGGWGGSWARFCDIFADESLVQGIRDLRKAADVGDITLLRTLDALLWRIGKGDDLREPVS